MRFAYFARLPAARKQTRRRSDAVARIKLPHGKPVADLLARIEAALTGGRRAGLEAASQCLLDALTARLKVPPVKVHVRDVRPSGRWGQLHGLYEPGESESSAAITVWMRTAARKQVVAYRTFVRILLHELCHHLDYELLKLPETFHTAGFYKREASLFRQIGVRTKVAGRV